jgi:hypothetical protein
LAHQNSDPLDPNRPIVHARDNVLFDFLTSGARIIRSSAPVKNELPSFLPHSDDELGHPPWYTARATFLLQAPGHKGEKKGTTRLFRFVDADHVSLSAGLLFAHPKPPSVVSPRRLSERQSIPL